MFEFLFGGVTGFIERILLSIGAYLAESFKNAGMDTFVPKLDFFSTFLGSENIVSLWSNLIQPLAYSLIVLVLLWNLIRSAMAKDVKGDVDEPLILIAKSAIAWLFVSYFYEFTSTIIGGFNEIFTYFSSVSGLKISNNELMSSIFGGQGIMGKIANVTIADTTAAAANDTGDTGGLINTIFRIYLSWTVLKTTFRLYYIYVERYVYYSIMYLFAPVGISVYASNKTRDISKKYMTALASAVLSLLLTGVLISMYAAAANTVARLTGGWPLLIMILGIGKFVMELDDWLNKIGLINQGGSIYDLHDANPLSVFGAVASIPLQAAKRIGGADKTLKGMAGMADRVDNLTGTNVGSVVKKFAGDSENDKHSAIPKATPNTIGDAVKPYESPFAELKAKIGTGNMTAQGSQKLLNDAANKAWDGIKTMAINEKGGLSYMSNSIDKGAFNSGQLGDGRALPVKMGENINADSFVNSSDQGMFVADTIDDKGLLVTADGDHTFVTTPDGNTLEFDSRAEAVSACGINTLNPYEVDQSLLASDLRPGSYQMVTSDEAVVLRDGKIDVAKLRFDENNAPYFDYNASLSDVAKSSKDNYYDNNGVLSQKQPYSGYKKKNK